MNTNYKILAMRLGCVRNRVSTLVHRLEYVRENGKAQMFEGYIPGLSSPHITAEFHLRPEDEKCFFDFIVNNYTKSDNAWNIIYHINNVVYVISDYYRGLCEGRHQASNAVLDEDIAGCHMVIDTIDDIISKLEACE